MPYVKRSILLATILSASSFSQLAGAAGEKFTSGPQTETSCVNVKLTSAYFVNLPDEKRKYVFDGTCTADLFPGAAKLQQGVSVHVEATYDPKTKQAVESIQASLSSYGEKSSILSVSNCNKDPFIIQPGNSCTLVQLNNTTAVPLFAKDMPLARGRTTEVEAKAKTPLNTAIKKIVFKPDDISIMSPVAEGQYGAEGVKFQVMVAKHYIEDSIECCELEFQNSIGGNWRPFKIAQETRIVHPKDLVFAHDWIDVSKSSKYRVRMRAIKKADYDVVPWSEWREFFIKNPSVDNPGTVTKPGQGGILTVPPAVKNLPAGTEKGPSTNSPGSSGGGSNPNPNPGSGSGPATPGAGGSQPGSGGSANSNAGSSNNGRPSPGAYSTNPLPVIYANNPGTTNSGGSGGSGSGGQSGGSQQPGGSAGGGSAGGTPPNPGTTTPSNAPAVDFSGVTCPKGWDKVTSTTVKGVTCKAAQPFLKCPAQSKYFIQAGPIMGCSNDCVQAGAKGGMPCGGAGQPVLTCPSDWRPTGAAATATTISCSAQTTMTCPAGSKYFSENDTIGCKL